MANKWQIGGIQRETKGNRRREKEAKFDFITKKNAHCACVCAKKIVPLSRILRFRQYGGLKSAKKLLKNIYLTAQSAYRI